MLAPPLTGAQVYFFDRRVYREELANLYIGYQVAGMTLSGVTFMAQPRNKAREW